MAGSASVTFDAIVQALHGKKEGNEWRCECPVHQGRSLSVALKNDKILFSCHQGCSQDDVLAALRDQGLWEPSAAAEAGVSRPPVRPAPKRGSSAAALVLEAEHHYYVGAGELLATKKRILTPDGKRFEWWRPNATRAGLGGLKVSEMPLFNAHLLPTEPEAVVWIVEGEKSAERAVEEGLLALSPAGGSAQTGFGKSLDPLLGRDVVLWPDNDAPGRILMQRLRSALDGKAHRVRTVTLPDLPEKGDAVDFFANGGTPAQLETFLAAVKDKPWVEQQDDDITVVMPDSGGYIRFEFASLTVEPRAIQADLTVTQEIVGVSDESVSGRMNILSLSNRNQYRVLLDRIFEREKGEWDRILNRACQLLRKASEETDRSIVLRDAPEDLGTGYLLYPFALSDGPTIMFGMGDSGKTFIALRITLAMVRGEELFGHEAAQTNVLYVDYEASAARLRSRLEGIARGLGVEVPPRIRYWAGGGIPLPNQIPAILHQIKTYNIGYMVVDSVAEACGGPPEKSEVAIPYMAAIARLGIPSLNIAHITKAEDNKKPFGSAHWHDKARVTINVQRVQEQLSDVIHCGVIHRKSNDDRKWPPMGIEIRFGDQGITFEREDVHDDFAREVSLPKRIRQALKERGKSVKELAEELSSKEGLVRSRLNDMPEHVRVFGRHTDGSKLWGLRARQEEG